MSANEENAFIASQEGEAKRTTLVEAFQALGSDVRLNLLKELIKGDCDISKLAEAVRLHPVTVRYHINILVSDGLVEKLVIHREGEVGRPPIRYRIRHKGMIGRFPPRLYEMLSEILLGIIDESLSREKWERMLYDAGREAGRQMIRATEMETQITVWNPRRFVQLYLEGALANLGLVTAAVEVGNDFVQYRGFTCPFQELALKYPEKICDYLDVGFHEGVAERLGTNVRHERLACMGHDDSYCEYRVRWTEIGEEVE